MKMTMGEILGDNNNNDDLTNKQMKVDPSDVDICETKTTAFITTMLGYLSWNQTGFRVQKIFFTSSLRRVMHST